MDKCKKCALAESKPCYECNMCMGGDNHFRPIPNPVEYAPVVQGSNWISVKDRLPEEDPTIKKHIEGKTFGFLTVLAFNGVVKQTNRFFCNIEKFGFQKTDGWEWASEGVTHWMPLPDPPEEEA